MFLSSSIHSLIRRVSWLKFNAINMHPPDLLQHNSHTADLFKEIQRNVQTMRIIYPKWGLLVYPSLKANLLRVENTLVIREKQALDWAYWYIYNSNLEADLEALARACDIYLLPEITSQEMLTLKVPEFR